MSRERRFSPGPVEIRSAGSQLRIGGYAAVFGAPSRLLPPRLVAGYEGPRPRQPFTEAVERGAFNESRARGWPGVVCRQEHEPTGLLGTVQAGTLRLAVDSTGMEYEVDLPPSRRDVLELVERGDIPGSSFSFAVMRPGLDDSWEESRSGLQRRLHSVLVLDVAPVAEPAYLATTAARRSMSGADALAQLEQRAGMSPGEALRLLGRRQARALLEESRAVLSGAERDQLPDSAFAYIEPGGVKDGSGRTVPRSKRHYPIHDEAHVRAALSRIGQGAQFSAEAAPKVRAAARRLGIEVDGQGAERSYVQVIRPPVALQSSGAFDNFHAHQGARPRAAVDAQTAVMIANGSRW